jgi:hypothetical protein
MSQTQAPRVRTESELDEGFSRRLELALPGADHTRRRRVVRGRIARFIPFLLLVAPVIGWRLILASPDGVHVTIGALAWVAFLLDVGVHVDASLLRYLGLQALPSIAGALLLFLITAWVLTSPSDTQ